MRAKTGLASMWAAGLLFLGAGAQGASAPDGGKIPTPRIEVVFVLDTTGSMSGLIRTAQEKIWAIASTLCQAQPAPEIGIGLVGYRDLGDQYVTRLTPLSLDLDRVYAELMSFRAQGGGDMPESVNQALYEAVTKIDWSADNSTYRVIFLVGDCPPHMDYQNDVPYPETCMLAAKKGIIINAIQCGGYTETMPFWTRIAELAGGAFFRVAQSGGAIETSTPYDADLARLSQELDATRIFYGDAALRAAQEERVALAGKIYREAPGSAVARRTVFNESESGKCNLLGDQELVNDVAVGRVVLTEVKEEMLPEELRKMPAAERAAFIDGQARKRGAIQAQIRELAENRQRYIRDEVVGKAGSKAAQSLDHQLYAALRTQAGEKGIVYKDGPVY